jgi:hypothetical protein
MRREFFTSGRMEESSAREQEVKTSRNRTGSRSPVKKVGQKKEKMK